MIVYPAALSYATISSTRSLCSFFSGGITNSFNIHQINLHHAHLELCYARQHRKAHRGFSTIPSFKYTLVSPPDQRMPNRNVQTNFQ